ncbi:MAG: endonuclease/exonuclease/phosphatase family protein [Phycisphaerae bacterium]|nr:endonuclease/exonuclease/phosphatase family protein [Phycisphaerae bacterium]
MAGCEAPAPDVLRLATLNVAHGRSVALHQIGLPRERFEQNLAAIAEVLRRERPDVVALQEADARSAWSGGFDHVTWLVEAVGFPYYEHGLHVESVTFGLPVRYGTALLSDRAMTRAESHAFDTGPLDTKGYVLAEIELAGRRVTVVSLHLDFRKASARRTQAADLVERLGRIRVPLVVMGDFNCAWDDTDDALRSIAHELDLHAYEPETADSALWTFPSQKPSRRLDWILASRQLVFRTYRCWPDRVSDHLGVAAELAWRR